MGEGYKTHGEFPDVSQGLWVQLRDVHPLQVTSQQSHALCGEQSAFSCQAPWGTTLHPGPQGSLDILHFRQGGGVRGG